MFELTHPLPATCIVALSGGPDSTAALEWLNRVPGRVVAAIYVHHKSEIADASQKIAEQIAASNGVPLYVRQIRGEPAKGQSLEEYWRDERYVIFEQISRELGGLDVVLGHQLNDCLEEYLICTLVRGHFGTIPYRHGPCIRPFRMWSRSSIEAFLESEEMSEDVILDPSNNDKRFLRVRVRRQLVPQVFEINPGIFNVVKKAIKAQDAFDGA